MRRMLYLLLLFSLLSFSALAEGTTRALLVACSDFSTMPDLGSESSGNLHMIASALISSQIRLGDLSIEDGTIGTPEAFARAVESAFRDAAAGDVSILYLCTHGVLSSSDDGGVYLLLGDGKTESPLSSSELYRLISSIQGEKLLILDACHSGALIGRGMPHAPSIPEGTPSEPLSPPSGFFFDPSIHVLTSASGSESSWYYDSEHLASGAVSYFASALAGGLGLYGIKEADLNGDDCVTLEELHRHLCVAVPSSSSQLLSSRAEDFPLPTASRAMLTQPLTGFSFGPSLLENEDPVYDFSFTVTQEQVGVQYRIVDFDAGAWNWENAKVFLDEGDDGSGALSPGRKTRMLSLEGLMPEESGYIMLQIFSITPHGVLLCAERLIAVQSDTAPAAFSLSCPQQFLDPGRQELPIEVSISVPAELTVSVYDSEGRFIRRLASSLLTRPPAGSAAPLYWDGRDASGEIVPPGAYVIAAETRIGGVRRKATADIIVGD